MMGSHTPAHMLWVPRDTPVALDHPPTLGRLSWTPALDHANVLWYSGNDEAAFELMKSTARPHGWRMTAHGPDMVVRPPRATLDQRMFARALPMRFDSGVPGHAITVYGLVPEHIESLFERLLTGPRTMQR